MVKLQKPERLTKYLAAKISETEFKMLKTLSKEYKVSVSWLIRQAIQTLWEENKKVLKT